MLWLRVAAVPGECHLVAAAPGTPISQRPLSELPFLRVGWEVVYPSKSFHFPALFCDYYNPEGQCEWHYQPCGAPCMRTCQNPTGQCLQDLRGLEGRLKAEPGGVGSVGFLGLGLGSIHGSKA